MTRATKFTLHRAVEKQSYALDPAVMTDQQLVDMMRRIAEEIPQSGAAAARARLAPYLAEARARVDHKLRKKGEPS